MPTDGRHGGSAHGDQHASGDDPDDLPQHPMRMTRVMVDGGEQVTRSGRVEDVGFEPQHDIVNPESRPIPEVPLQGHLRQSFQQEEHLIRDEEHEKPHGDRAEQLHLAVQDHLVDDQPEDIRVGAAQKGGCHHRHEQVHEGEQRWPDPSPDSADPPETALARRQVRHQSLRVRSAWRTEVVPTATSISVAVSTSAGWRCRGRSRRGSWRTTRRPRGRRASRTRRSLRPHGATRLSCRLRRMRRRSRRSRRYRRTRRG